MTVLVTGFDPFQGAPFNPSGEVAQRVTGASGHVLPTSYERAKRQIEVLLSEHQPSLVIMLGLHDNTEQPLLERFAINVDDSLTPDNDGETRSGRPIRDDGPAAFRTDLDLAGMQASLSKQGFDVGVSNHAGAFVCNHTYYCAFAAAPEETSCLFIHIPPADPEDKASLNDMARLVEAVIAL